MIPIKNSIAARLLKVVFSLYLTFAVCVTLGHMVLEYHYQKESIHKDLENIQKTFEQGLAIDLWDMDQKSLSSTVEGMLNIPVIVGVKIQDNNNLEVAVGGIISQKNGVGNVGLHVDLIGLNHIESNEKYNLELFMHRFPIIYSYDKESNQLGTATIYSSTSVILKRLKSGFLLLIVAAVIKTVALWGIFLWFSNRLLRRPLAALAAATQKVNLDNLDSFNINIGTTGKNELSVIESSFNSMIKNLHYSVSKNKKEEERYRKTIEISIDGFWIADIQGNLIETNEAYANMTGYSRDELLKMSIMDVEAVEHPEEIKKRIEKIMQSGSDKFESRHRHKKGHIIDVEVSTSYTQDSCGMFFTFLRDITDRNKIDDRLRQAQKMESIGTLAGGIAHDFNNILFPIVGHTQMLLEDTPEESPYKNGLNQIYTGAMRASELVKQILAFSRQESGELKLMKMQPIIKETLKLIRSTIPTTIEIKQNISPACGVIKADPTQIHQIVMNLATNAYHAMEDMGGELIVGLNEIKLGVLDLINPDMTPGQYACLTVADTGTGMDKELTQKIFDPFFTTKAVGKGTGMGLSVVHGIVEGMGGAVLVYSEPGKGTQFYIYFPIEKGSFVKHSVQTHEIIQGGIERILLVDDEDAIITMEKLELERLGYQVTSRISSTEALEAFRADPDKFNLIITDMAMPNMTGDKLSAELTKIRPDIPILLCTGFSETMSEEKAASLGIKGFLLKPIVMKDLAQKIREVLDGIKVTTQQ
jgi:PAS domain S-box-containing protein